MEKRENIAKKYKWDLSLLYNNENDFSNDLKTAKILSSTLVKYRGKLNNKETILEYLNKEEQLSKVIGKAGLYPFLLISLNGADKKALKMQSELQILEKDISLELAFVNNELSLLSDEFLYQLKKENGYETYNRVIDSIIKNKPHILSEKEEQLLTKVADFEGSSETFDALDNVELKFGKVKDENGKSVQLTGANFSTLASSHNESVRKKVFEKLHSTYKKFNMTISSLYIQTLKSSLFFSEAHKFGSTLERKMFSEEVSEKTYVTLLNTVNDNLKSYQNVLNLRAKMLGNERYHIYDNYVSATKKVDFKKSYEESVNLLLESTKMLGKDYSDAIRQAVNNRWIDVFETENKDKGAFNVDCNEYNPFILLNYIPSYNSTTTLCHEMGHAMNSYFTNKYQPYSKRGNTIFTAEVASTVNECLLNFYLYNSTDNKDLKIFLLDKFLIEFNATVYRQTMFSEFEKNCHDIVTNKQPITYDNLNKIHENLQKKYFGKDVVFTKNAKYEWSRIPHFYRPFYVYKYATGFISAVYIAANLFNGTKGFAEKYIKFLSAGTSDTPINILKIVDIDIEKETVFNQAFKLYNDKYLEIKSLFESKEK